MNFLYMTSPCSLGRARARVDKLRKFALSNFVSDSSSRQQMAPPLMVLKKCRFLSVGFLDKPRKRA
jgi:hypothetical protein